MGKMAEGMSDDLVEAQVISNTNEGYNEIKCICCERLQQELEVTLLELKTARTIIQLLQEEVNSTPRSINDNTRGRNIPSASNSSSDYPKKKNPHNWKQVPYNTRKYNTKSEIQGPQPIPTVINRYTLLSNLQDESDSLQSQGTVDTIEVVKTKTSCTPGPRKKKIIIIGDSHARGYAAEVSSYLGKSFEVMGTVMPGSRLENITHLASKEISNLHRNDFVVIWGGANDVNKNETNFGLKHIRKFALQNSHTNIIFITVPHRHDLQESSCINREVQVFNRKLHKIMKAMGHVDILDTKLNRNKFTRHGLHFNISGKEKMANHIGERIINLSKRQKNPTIACKWKEDPKENKEEEGQDGR